MATFESGARAALKSAIAVRDEVASRVEATRQALDRISEQVFDAQRKLRETQASAVDDAHARVERIIAGGAATLELNGRQREAAIEEEIGAIKAARELTRAALSDGERSLDLAEMRVRDAVGNVLASAAPRLIAETEAAKAGFTAKASLLSFLRSSLSDACRRKADEALVYPLSLDDVESPLLSAWKSAAAALAQDSNAALPE